MNYRIGLMQIQVRGGRFIGVFTDGQFTWQRPVNKYGLIVTERYEKHDLRRYYAHLFPRTHR
jgi:hypothetical protein